MNLILAATPSTEGWIGLLFKVAVVCIVCWGVWELIKWTGWPIPRPVIIIATCLVAILLIYWLIQLFQMLI